MLLPAGLSLPLTPKSVAYALKTENHVRGHVGSCFSAPADQFSITLQYRIVSPVLAEDLRCVHAGAEDEGDKGSNKAGARPWLTSANGRCTRSQMAEGELERRRRAEYSRNSETPPVKDLNHIEGNKYSKIFRYMAISRK